MTQTILHLFADVTAKLEDLHAVAVEGQRTDDARDMQQVLISHFCSGIAALEVSMRAIATTLDGDGR